MKKTKHFLVLIGLTFALLSSWSYAESCFVSLDCSPWPAISCSIVSSGANTVNCWVGTNNNIVCCEFDPQGNPVRDIHKQCPSGGGGSGGGEGPRPPV